MCHTGCSAGGATSCVLPDALQEVSLNVCHRMLCSRCHVMCIARCIAVGVVLQSLADVFILMPT